ncbi:phage tail length tape-measure protein [Vibrio phage pTD1]|uniref:Phage tail length tape-measure protein n=1 Tax=Vibrio phage pTD1 TaxID=1938577 RepID=A0A1Q2U2W8_9CAUD|nr:virion structural protein [Vibrio phage pTD1]BAW98308.1 phage tail length tape-measure protein [Vibrio phage pTD1]
MSTSPNFVDMGTAGTVGVGNTERKQLIDLDETYDDVTNPEETAALAEYLKTGKLSKKALETAKVAGTERFEPGCTTLNGLLGGESFLESISNGITEFVRRVIEMISNAAKWMMAQFRRISSFFTDGREIAKADEMLRDIESKLVEMGGPELNVLDVKELFGKDPVSSRRISVVRTLRARNQTTLEAAAKLQEALPALKDFIAEINRQEGSIQRLDQRFASSIGRLRKRAKDDSLTNKDKAEWVADVMDMIAQNIQQQKLQRNYVKLLGIMTDRTSGNLDDDKLFAESTKAMQNLMQVSKDDVKVEDFVALSRTGSNIRQQIVDNPDWFNLTLDSSLANKLTQVIKHDDLAFLQALPGDNTDILATYRLYTGAVGNYTSILRQSTDVALKFTAEIQYLAEWSQRYQFLLTVFSFQRAKERNDFRKAHKKETGVEIPIGNLASVPKDARDDKDRSFQRIYDALFPDVKRKLNSLSRTLNMGVNL